MIDQELLGIEGHLIRVCPRCYARAVRVACPVLGTLREELREGLSDFVECPRCYEGSRLPCPIEGAE